MTTQRPSRYLPVDAAARRLGTTPEALVQAIVDRSVPGHHFATGYYVDRSYVQAVEAAGGVQAEPEPFRSPVHEAFR
jgi:hypothetical protein